LKVREKNLNKTRMQDQNYCMIYLCSTCGYWFFFWHLQTFLKYEYESTVIKNKKNKSLTLQFIL